MRARAKVAHSQTVWRSCSKVYLECTFTKERLSLSPPLPLPPPLSLCMCVCVCLSEAAKSGENLFRDVLRCKVRADQTRSALTVLQRYRFLFNLPHTIEKNINSVSMGLS